MRTLDLTKVEMESIIKLRHELHSYPELSHQEQHTKEILLSAIEKLELKITEVPNSAGFFVDLDSEKSERLVALRADMDALPVQEKNKIDFRSRVKGKMHACGHDGHMSILYGAMLALSKYRSALQTGVRFIFQPAEEEATKGGAREMIEARCLDRVSFITGIHMWPELKEGQVGYRSGPFFAGLNRFHIDVKGGKTHSARPDLGGPNSISVVNQIISSIDTIINRRSYPWAPYRINLYQVQGTPNETKLTGSIAYTLPDQNRLSILPGFAFEKVKGSIAKVSKAIAMSSGAKARVTFDIGYPPLVTDSKATDIAVQAVERVMGKGHAIPSDMTLGGEDFSLYLHKVPGTYILMGINNKVLGFESMIHTPTFNFNDMILPKGSLILAEIARIASQNYT